MRISIFLLVVYLFVYNHFTAIYKPLLITSNSMEPTIKQGAIVLLHYTDLEHIQVGDIITFYSRPLRSLNTHRVISRTSDYLCTKGDGAKHPDACVVTSHTLRGKIVFVWNQASTITPYFMNSDGTYNKTKAITICLGVVVILLLLLYRYK